MASSLILFAHGARDPEWARPLQGMRARILAREPARDVRLAFLEFMSPSLGEAIDEAAAQGARSLRIVPVFLAQGGHVRRDVPLILAAAQQRHPQLEIELMPAIGETPSVIEALADAALSGESVSHS